jgi:hypothetical protein
MKTFSLSALLVAGMFISGCASNSDVREAKMEALRASDDAKRIAEQALNEARDAKSLAQDANSRAMRSEEMLNRGFKRSMYK